MRDFAAEDREIAAAVAGMTGPKALLATAAAHPDVLALRVSRSDARDSWQTWTWAQYRDDVAQAAAGLRGVGIQAGDRVVLMMRNRPEFHILDTALQFLRATPVSIYNSSSPEEIEYQAHHCEATVAIVEDGGFLAKVLSVRDQLPKLHTIIVLLTGPQSLAAGLVPYADLFQHGTVDLDELAALTSPDDLATLIYTSGTTGPPKGVMLDQANVMYTAEQLIRCYRDLLGEQGTVGRRVISYLPMAHIAERMSSHYQHLLLAMTVTCCPDMAQLGSLVKDVRPEVMFGVPRIWEKFYSGVNAALATDPDKQTKFNEGVALAKTIVAARRAGTATAEQLETLAFLDAVAFAPVRAMLGLDDVVLAISGAAPISHDLIEWYNAIGVALSEIYGMSESSGPMNWEAHPDRIKPGSVGPAIPGCEVALADDGEIMCRGGNVFRGYYKAPDKTAETVVDGWLRTGDIGVIDADGFLKIVDRKKELIITAGGKNISPANLELELKTIPLIGQACAIGDGRKFVSALLVLDPEYAPIWAKAHGIEGTLAELAEDLRVVAEVSEGVREVNARFASVEHIRRFHLIGEEWLPDSDVLTPTSKLKRRGVHARYAAEIEAMYKE
ncbi:MAG: long-chain fatty acid--CoA ligase [Acidimicrobiia bacterium]